MGLFARALMVAAAGILIMAPASSVAETWGQAIALGRGGFGVAPQGVPLGSGTYGVTTLDPTSVVVVSSADGGPAALDTQILADGYGSQPTLAADADGAPVAAWYETTDQSIEASIGTPSGRLGAAAVVSAGTAVPAQAAPLLAVSPLGWAAVMFLAGDAGGQSVYVAVRPPGQAFGPAEAITTPTATNEATTQPASLAINDRGEVVAAYEQDDVASAALRAAGADGEWDPPAVLGGPWSGLTASDLQVGIDAYGGAVAVWKEAGADTVDPFTASVMAAFRPAGGAFGPPEGLLDADTRERYGLGVSGFGEVILAVHPVDAVSHDLQPVTVSSGSTVLGRFGPPVPVAASWDEFNPRVAVNGRGDAVLTTDKPNTSELIARRRAPFGPFGAAEEIVPPPYGPVSSITDPESVFRAVADVALDRLGNATVTWTDDAAGAPIFVSVGGPLVTSAPDVTLPDPLGLAELVAADPAAPGAQLAGPAPPDVLPVARVPIVGSPPPGPSQSRPAPTDGHVALVIERAPPPMGSPRIVVALTCPTACRVGLEAILVTPSKKRIVLPAAALALDSGGAVRRVLKLSPTAIGVLRTRPASGAGHDRPRRFKLTITAVAGDASGVPQTARASVSFTRR